MIGLGTVTGITDLLDVVFTSLQVKKASRESETLLADLLKKEFEILRLNLLIGLPRRLGLTGLQGLLLAGLQVNLEFISLLGILETGLQVNV